jgi:hypothetical protein
MEHYSSRDVTRLRVLVAIVVLIGLLSSFLAWIGGTSVGTKRGEEAAVATFQMVPSPEPQTLLVTQIVPAEVTREVEVTRQVEVAQKVEVTQQVEVTREVEVTRQVEVTRIASVSEPPTIPIDSSGNTPDGTILNMDETWKSDGFEFTLHSPKFNSSLVTVEWSFKNNTDQVLTINVTRRNFSAENNFKEELSYYNSPYYANHLMNPGEEQFYTSELIAFRFDPSKCQNEIVVTIENISRLKKAQWRIPVNLC